MRPSLADRLRGVVNVSARAPDATEPVVPRPPAPPRSLTRIANTLGGHLVERAEGTVLVIDRHFAADGKHGRERIGDIAETLVQGGDGLRLIDRAWPSKAPRSAVDGSAPPSLLFLDLETTGLAGGAGTQAFLIGLAVLEDDAIHVRQYLLPGFEHERALLAEVGSWTEQLKTLVTFNGRSFDVPLIETRYLFHRLAFPLADRPHVDMLHPSRRLWKERPSIAGPPLDEDSCKLAVLERHMAGVHRIGDVPGFEIPSRFFRFVRDGDAAPLQAVLEHNRIDLLSLALVTARAIRLIEQGPSAARHPRECLGLGRLYERAGRAEDAESAFAQAASLAARVGREPDVRAESLKRLALCRRRSGRLREAAAAWQDLVSLPSCPSALRREAREALAIHHEHRSRDLITAKTFVLETLAENPAPRWREEAQYRLQRLDRKLAVRTEGGLFQQWEGA